MLSDLPLLFKNSVRNKRRTILTTLSVAASLCLLALMMALYHNFYLVEASPEQARRLVVRNRVSLMNPLPLSYERRISQAPGVKEAVIFQWFGGTYKDARDPANFFGRFGVEPEKLAVVYPEYKLPDAERAAFIAERASCVVGRKTANRHNLQVGDRITIVGDIFPVTLNLVVRGIYDANRDNENLIFHWEYLNQSLQAAARGRMNQVGCFVVLMERPQDAAAMSKGIDDLFRNSPVQTKTETERAFEISFMAFVGNVKLFLMAIGAAVTFTILLVAGNSMAMSVRERIHEIGVLKTIGYTPGRVLSLLLGEALLIAMAGGVLGVALAEILCSVLRSAPSMFADMSRLGVHPPVVAASLLAAAVIGLASSLLPALSAARRPIVEALRVSD